MDDYQFMELAIAQARRQVDKYGFNDGGERPNPIVGCVVVKDGKVVGTAYRGETYSNDPEDGRNDHAEFIALQKKLKHVDLEGATVYTTLEPCAHRGKDKHGNQKHGCAVWLIKRKVHRVVMGYRDPDPKGAGFELLVQAKIKIDDFPNDLMIVVRQLNHNFIQSRIRAAQEHELKMAENYYHRNRSALQKLIRPYYEMVDERADFPLIVREGFILEKPERLTLERRDAFLAPLIDANFEDSEFDEADVRAMFLGRTYREFKADYKRGVNVEDTLFNGFSYRLMKIDVGSSGPLLSFAKSRYFGYLNSCEARAFEQALKQVSTTRVGKTLRRPPKAIFDLKNRNATAGVSTITIVVDRAGSKPLFIFHYRTKVEEGMGTTHVVPAGQFQPIIPEHLAGWDAPQWNDDFSLLDTMLREFLEEVLNLEKRIKASSESGNWRSTDEIVREAYTKLTGAMRAESGVPIRCKAWFFGLGFDPLTEKPEILTAMVVDRSLLDELKLHWNEEGRGEKVEMTRDDLSALMAHENSNWLSAGMACLHCAFDHYERLTSCLSERD